MTYKSGTYIKLKDGQIVYTPKDKFIDYLKVYGFFIVLGTIIYLMLGM